MTKARSHVAGRSLCTLCAPGSREIGSLSNSVFEGRTSTGSEAFFLFICLDAIKFSLLTFFSLLKTIHPRVLTKPLPNDAKSPLPVDVRRSKTLLLKLPNEALSTTLWRALSGWRVWMLMYRHKKVSVLRIKGCWPVFLRGESGKNVRAVCMTVPVQTLLKYYPKDFNRSNFTTRKKG